MTQVSSETLMFTKWKMESSFLILNTLAHWHTICSKWFLRRCYTVCRLRLWKMDIMEDMKQINRS